MGAKLLGDLKEWKLDIILFFIHIYIYIVCVYEDVTSSLDGFMFFNRVLFFPS